MIPIVCTFQINPPAWILGEANDSKPAESSERICPFGCVICVSCGEIAVPCHNDQLGIVTG